MQVLTKDDDLTVEQRIVFDTALQNSGSTMDLITFSPTQPETLVAGRADRINGAISADRTGKVAFSSTEQAVAKSKVVAETTGTRETSIAARLSRRSSLTDDRVDEVISNLTNMHSMVKLLRAGSVDKPDASRTWDDLAQDLEDERTARIIAEEAASANQRQADEALSEAGSLRQQLALLMQQLCTQQPPPDHFEALDAGTDAEISHRQAFEATLENAVKHRKASDADTVAAAEQIEQLQRQVVVQQQALLQLRRDLKQSVGNATVAEQSIDGQSAEIANQAASAAIAGATELRKQLQMTQQQLHEQLQDGGTFTKQHEEAFACERKAFVSQIEQLQRQLESEISSAQKHDSDMQLATRRLETEVQSLTQQLQTRQQEQETSHAQHESSQAQLEAFHEQLRQQQQDHQETATQLATVQAQFATTHSQLQHQLQVHESATAQHASAMAQLTAGHDTAVQQLHLQLSVQQEELKASKAAQHAHAEGSQQDGQHQLLRQQLAAQQAQHDGLQSDLRRQLEAQKARTHELESELMTAQQLLNAHQSTDEQGNSAQNVHSKAQLHQAQTGSATEQATSTLQYDQARHVAEADTANAAAEPDQATAIRAQPQLPDQASTTGDVAQLPDQASAAVSAFQARLQSMLPQLPALQKLEQLSLEVGRLEGLESEVDQLQHVLQSVAAELESGHLHAQAMQRRVAAAEHALKKAELRVRGAELRAESAEAELSHLRKHHAHTRNSNSPWKSPGQKPWSPKASPRVSPTHLPGFEPRLLEPEDVPHDSSASSPSSSLLQSYHASSHKNHSSVSLKHNASSSQAQRQHPVLAKPSDVLQTSARTSVSAQAESPRTSQANAQQGGVPSGAMSEHTASPASVASQSLHKLGSYRITDFELDEEDAAAAAEADADPASADDLSRDEATLVTSERQFEQAQHSKPRMHARGKSKASGVQALPTTTAHLLRQKPPPSSRFGSPARSLPPYLRSYRNFTQTALLGSTSAQSSDSRLSPRPQTHSPRSGPRLKAHGQSSNSASQRSAELQLSALREAAQRSSSCNRGAKQEGAGPNAQCLSAHPDYRPRGLDSAALAGSKSAARITYGMEPAFAAARQQYEDDSTSDKLELTEHDRTQNWLKSLTVNKAKAASDPKLVDQKVYRLQQLMLSHGLDLPFKKTGPCQYSLGVYKLRLKVGGNKLLTRCGGGYEDLLYAIEKMSMCT